MFTIAQNLRSANIPTEIDLSRKKFKKLLSHANNLGVKYTVLVGAKDLENNQVTIKNMGSGNQELIDLDNIVNFIKDNL